MDLVPLLIGLGSGVSNVMLHEDAWRIVYHPWVYSTLDLLRETRVRHHLNHVLAPFANDVY